MSKTRKIIEINEEKCTGCGQCVSACVEGALAMVNGKARLVSDVYCDGLGACIGECPAGALKIIERQAGEFDEAEVKKHQKIQPIIPAKEEKTMEKRLPCGCPSSQAMALKPGKPAADCEPNVVTSPETGRFIGAEKIASELTHWPIKLQLLNPQAPFLKGADLLLLADCVAAALPDLHRKLLRNRAVVMGCPKLDDLNAHTQRLSEILRDASPKSLTVAHMEVPCCHGFMFAAKKAIELAGINLPLGQIIISRMGEIL